MLPPQQTGLISGTSAWGQTGTALWNAQVLRKSHNTAWLEKCRFKKKKFKLTICLSYACFPAEGGFVFALCGSLSTRSLKTGHSKAGLMVPCEVGGKSFHSPWIFFRCSHITTTNLSAYFLGVWGDFDGIRRQKSGTQLWRKCCLDYFVTNTNL